MQHWMNWIAYPTAAYAHFTNVCDTAAKPSLKKTNGMGFIGFFGVSLLLVFWFHFTASTTHRITHRMRPPQGDWLGLWSQYDVVRPRKDSSLSYILCNLDLKVLSVSASTTDASRWFHVFTIRSVKKWCLRSVATLPFLSFKVCPLVRLSISRSKKVSKSTADRPWYIPHTSIRSALSRLSSRVHRCKDFSLSSWESSLSPGIRRVKRLWIFSKIFLSFW